MGVFCPNCGSKNESTATPCGSCGFRLAGVSAPKFKGTMMLSSDQAVKDLLEAHKADGEMTTEAQKATLLSSPETTAVARPATSGKTMLGIAAIPRPRQVEQRRKMAGTMLGVAPQASVTSRSKQVPVGSTGEEVVRRANSVDQTLISPEPVASTEQAASIPVVAVTRSADDDMSIPLSGLSAPEPDSTNDALDIDVSQGTEDSDSEPATVNPAASATNLQGSNSQDKQEDAQPRSIVTGSAVGRRPVADSSDQKKLLRHTQRMTAFEVFLSIITLGIYALIRRLRR